MNLPSFLLALGLYLTLSFCSGSEENLGRPFILSAVEEAKKLVDDAYKYSREESLARVRRDDVRPSDILRLMKQPARDTRSAVRAADYMAQTLRLIHDKTHHVHKRSINATDLLTPEELETIERLTGCAARVQPPSCRTTPQINKYRTASSVCNNLKNPRLGASNTAFARWLPAEYEDGISQPMGWDPSRLYNHVLLPLVREVSNRILSTTDAGVTSDREFSYLVTLFGQWNDHDLTFTPTSPSIRSFSSGLNCDESCERSEPCFPIPIPSGDPRIPSGPNSCIPVFRSAPACGTSNTAFMFGGRPMVLEQINALTAFLDVGQVYGSEDGLARHLRDLTNDGGLLRINKDFTDHGRELLPFSSMVGNMCATRRKITNDADATEVPCFVAGDSRVDENIGLTSLHTLFMREHNRLARALRLLNPRWSSDTLYQEARKIMGANHQVIVFRDYLQHIVGPDVLQRQLGRYPGYDDNIDPSIANVFATAAYRFAHATIQPLMFRLDENYQEHPQFPSMPLFETFSAPWRVVFEGGVDPLIRGLVGRPAKLNQQDHILVDAIREKLFFFTSHLALDLGSLNMQRGRDHGLQGYNAWRRHCGLSTPQNEAELAQVLNNADLAHRLLHLYGTPANIDVWLGGVAEPFVPGGRVGPLFACLIATQFQKIRQGDRLWWERPGVFTPKQRESLARVSLARIICDNTGISDVPSEPFLFSRRGDCYTRCDDIPLLDLTPWIESASETDVTCEGLHTTLDCGNDVIQINSANFGRTDQTTCTAGRPASQVTKTDCNSDATTLSIVANSCHGKTKCSVQASNSVFSDPCVGTYKYLDISYTCIPTRTSVTCEGHQSVLDCGNNLIKIHSANYGRTDQTTCSAGRPTGQVTKTNCHTPDALVKVSESCDGKTKCSVQASNVIFADPCFGTFKYLDISYVCLPHMTSSVDNHIVNDGNEILNPSRSQALPDHGDQQDNEVPQV